MQNNKKIKLISKKRISIKKKVKNMEYITLNNGVKMPILGFEVYQYLKKKQNKQYQTL